MSNSGEMRLTNSFQWLPPGWKVEVKPRPTGVIKDKTYIDPVSGRKFRSRLEVLRYLGILESSTPKIRDGSNSNAIRIVQDGSLDQSYNWLPFNWQVEFKETKNHRVDRYYIHPVSGYKFRSKPEVHRYLQNGEMPKDRLKRRADDAELPSGKHLMCFNSWGVKKLRKQAQGGTRRCVFTGKISSNGKVKNDKQIVKLSDVYASERSWKGMECYRELACAEKDYILALSVVSAQRLHLQNSFGKSSNTKIKPSPQETDNERAYGVSCLTNRRLAGLEPELLPGTGEGKQIVLSEFTAEVDTEKEAKSKIRMPMVKVDNGKVMHSLGARKRLSEPWQTPEYRDAPADYSMKFALSGPQSGFTLPFGETSRDPCLDFAYKTLTGIIPLENLPIKGFFHQHVTSVSTQNTGFLK